MDLELEIDDVNVYWHAWAMSYIYDEIWFDYRASRGGPDPQRLSNTDLRAFLTEHFIDCIWIQRILLGSGYLFPYRHGSQDKAFYDKACILWFSSKTDNPYVSEHSIEFHLKE